MNPKKTLVYSCSGCSSAAQIANALALRLDREGQADMSCIAGVGGGVKSLVNVAKSKRPIIAIDGCPLKCVVHCLETQGVKPNLNVVLSEWGHKKKLHEQAPPEELEQAYVRLLKKLEEQGLCKNPIDRFKSD